MNVDEFREMDFYSRLGVTESADTEEIERAYRARVQEYHPDVSEHDDAQELFKLIKEAEETLTDPDERAYYERLGHEQYLRQQSGPGSAYSVDQEATTQATTESAGTSAGHQAAGAGNTRGTNFAHGLGDVEERNEPAPSYPDGNTTGLQVGAYLLSAVVPMAVVCGFPLLWLSLFGLSGPGGSVGMLLAYFAVVVASVVATVAGAESLLSTPRRIQSLV